MLQWGHNRPHQVWQVGGGSSALGMPCSVAPFPGGPGSSALNNAQMTLSQGKTLLPATWTLQGRSSLSPQARIQERAEPPWAQRTPGSTQKAWGTIWLQSKFTPSRLHSLTTDILTTINDLVFKGWSSKIVADLQLCFFQLLYAL